MAKPVIEFADKTFNFGWAPTRKQPGQHQTSQRPWGTKKSGFHHLEGGRWSVLLGNAKRAILTGKNLPSAFPFFHQGFAMNRVIHGISTIRIGGGAIFEGGRGHWWGRKNIPVTKVPDQSMRNTMPRPMWKFRLCFRPDQSIKGMSKAEGTEKARWILKLWKSSGFWRM